MRQPKYKIGDSVIIPIKVYNDTAGFKTVTSVHGQISGIEAGFHAGLVVPKYEYTVFPKQAERIITIPENQIELIKD